MNRWILRLEAVALADLATVGSKGANLGHLLRAGLPVPNGYCITTDAYDLIVATAGAASVISTALAELPGESDVARFEQVSEQITSHFRELPPELWEAIRAAQRELAGPVAVRSSATAEDLPGASFAGQQETVLDVQDEKALQQAILACFASLWSARAIQYRQRMNFPHAAVKLCVLVQVPGRQGVGRVDRLAADERSGPCPDAGGGGGVSELWPPDREAVRPSARYRVGV